MSPERSERGQERRKFGMEGREEIEGLFGAGANGFVVGERGTGGEIALHSCGGVMRGEDGEAGDERARLARRSGEILRGKMKTRERLAGGMRVRRAAKRRPGDRVLVEIDARGRFVHFVGPLARFRSLFLPRLTRARAGTGAP